MSTKPGKNSVAHEIDELERILASLTEAEQRKFINEDILRLEKNGDLSYESIRTTAVPNSYTVLPIPCENGQKFPATLPPLSAADGPTSATELPAASPDTPNPELAPPNVDSACPPGISIHDDPPTGQQMLPGSGVVFDESPSISNPPISKSTPDPLALVSSTARPPVTASARLDATSDSDPLQDLPQPRPRPP